MARPDLTAALDRYSDLKVAVCGEALGPADLVMLLEVRSADGHLVIASPDGTACLTPAIRVAAADLPSPVDSVVLLSEGYVREMTDAQAAEAARGDQRRAFLDGDPAVSEVMMAVAFDAEGFPLGALWRRCAYDDSGLPTFPEPDVVLPPLYDGAVLDAVRAALRP